VGFNRAGDGAADTITVPEGLYWNDPVYGGSQLTYSLQGRVAALMDAEEGAAYWTVSPTGAGGSSGIVSWTETVELNLSDITPATCNAEGKRVLQRLGLSPSRVTTPFEGSWDGGAPEGLWDTGDNNGNYRAERNVTFPGVQRERGGVLVGFSGRAWPATVGAEEERRVITLEAVPRVAVRDEVGAVNVGYSGGPSDDFTLYTLFWRWASRGELVRVYSDKDATKTYVTSAVTEAATTISVASGTGLANDDVIWVDGERMLIISGGGTTTLTVERPNATTHSAGAPVSDAHVATYALDADGGNVNLLDFAPVRRAYNDPRYDVEIALVRAKWEG
jgi:hypothetical protein